MDKKNNDDIIPIAGTKNTKRSLDIIFIHGLGGDAFSTWQYEDEEKFFWPKALSNDFPNIGVWTIGYGATPSRWIEDVMPMEDRTENLLNQLSLTDVGNRPFIVVAHSMGGLIAKSILVQANQSDKTEYNSIAENCLGVVFLAVPHNGSGWSNLLKYAQALVRSNEILKQLSKDSPALRQLDKNFLQLIDKNEYLCYSFYETKEVRLKKKLFGFISISKGLKVVSESSATGSFLKTSTPLEEDHFSICKPQSKESLLYKNITKFITNYLDVKKNRTNFTSDWFKEHIKASISDLGHRYTPKLNVELDISKKFDCICRNNNFKKLANKAFHDLLLAIRSAKDTLNLEPLKEYSGNLATIEIAFKSIFETTQKNIIDSIDLNSLQDNCDSANKIINDCIAIISKEIANNKDYKGDGRHKLRNTKQAIYDFQTFMEEQYFNLANQPVLLLSGEAGTGKSHLLADIAFSRIKSNKPCILLLGQQFTSDNSPWSQILSDHIRLGFKNEDELLSELNSIAEENGERVLFCIDAINEGQGCNFWPDHISSFINKFLNYPWIGLVLSIRSSYEKLLIPEDLIPNDKAIRVTHHGFSSIEYEASRFFFIQYGIEHPSIPLLHPEFSNPLFLKLFCEGLHRSGLSKMPKGHTGISKIINFFLDSIDKKLCAPKLFDYPCDQHLVRKVVDKLIRYKLENEDKNFIPYATAFELADKALGKFSSKRRFLDTLISEGVLSKNLYWKADGNHEEGIYLAYERFEDHFTASHLLDKFNSLDDLQEAFSEGNVLHNIINYHRKQGLLEALSIQIPEKLGCELYECLDKEGCSKHNIMEALINSLLWRKTETIGDESRKYINKYILKHDNTRYQFFRLVYSVAADPEHPFNADSLHRYLMPTSMADRDAHWTTFLHEQNYEGYAIPRFIDWALSNADKRYLSDESRLLAGKALAWIFPSTNIPFRDSATEGLVNLLENNIPVITKLLIEFKGINDPYVYERILAAAYGGVLRSNNLIGLKELSEYIVEYFFEQPEEVYPNVLVRDYARNIVEYSLYKNIINLEDKEIIRPPYRSQFPDIFPNNNEINAYKYDYKSQDFKEYFWGQNAILSSMTTEYGRDTGMYGDFGRYTFQGKVHHWDFDPNDLSNYACKLIFNKYGYDADKHGEFDQHASSSRNGRHDNLTERIGKKYQWIALYEVLARLSDNHKMIDESTQWGEEKNFVWYQGAWEPFVRNIDPTAKVFSAKKDINVDQDNWWNRFEYNDWNINNEEWLSSTKNLPCEEQPITVVDPDQIEWLVLETYQQWEETIPIGVDKFESPHKELWMMLKSILVKESDFEKLYSWMKDQHFWGRWFPEGGNGQYQIFCREYYWSPAYRFFDNPYYGRNQWEDVSKRGSNKVNCKVLSTSEEHTWETGANYTDAPNYLAPRQAMFEGMKLQYSETVGEWLDENGEVACFDPAIKYGEGNSCLLVRKEIFQKYLNKNGLKLIWTILGDKRITNSGFSPNKYPLGIEFSGIYTLDKQTVIGGLTQTINPN